MKHRALIFLGFLGLFYGAITPIGGAEPKPRGFALQPAGGTVDTIRVFDDRLQNRDGSRISYEIRLFRWIPEQSNGFVFVYNHGFQSHSAWFFATAEALSEMGFAVYAFDRIGSGQSAPGVSRSFRRDYVAPGTIQHWQLFTKTLDRVVAKVQQERPTDRLIVWANSYGAKIVTAWMHMLAANQQSDRVAAAVFTTPGLYQNKETMPLPFAKMRLVFSHAHDKFPLPMVDRGNDNGASWFVSAGQWFDAIKYDDLSLRFATKDYYVQTALMDRYNRKRRKKGYDVPAFFLLVDGDELMDNDRMEKDIQQRAANGYYKYYSGGPENKHFLMFTEDKAEVISDIEKFVMGRYDEIDNLHTTRHAENQ